MVDAVILHFQSRAQMTDLATTSEGSVVDQHADAEIPEQPRVSEGVVVVSSDATLELDSSARGRTTGSFSDPAGTT